MSLARLNHVFAIAAVGGWVALACTTSAPGPCDLADCTDPDSGGDSAPAPVDGATPDGAVAPPGCDTPTEPLKNPEKCLVDAFGAFVSPTGDDSNDGTKAKPFKTIGKALGTTRSRIVVCEGTYASSVDVTRAAEIYGGVTCDWSRAGAKAKVVASKASYGIKIAKVSGAVILADLEVVGLPGAQPGESSVGVFVSESGNVRLIRARIEAGDGAEAAPKKDGNYTYSASSLLVGRMGDEGGTVGVPEDDKGGVGGATGTCPGGGSSTGGRGGDFGKQGSDGAPRPPGGLKGPVGDCTAAGAGLPGDPGGDGPARVGASRPATLAAEGLAGSKGEDGVPGTPGGAGGGGYGTLGGGGGGGAGGCGGAGGVGGTAGGSSIALLSFGSTVAVEGSELVAKVAKVGGAGGAGQTGQAGGIGGNRSGAACNGGNGNKGGDGGSGGGGAGGISAGIAWAGGVEPSRDGATTITRPTGAAPVGGEGGPGATKGVDGAHADSIEVK